MCSPVVASVVGSAAIGGLQARQQQKAENAALEYNASISDRNAQIADQQAKFAEQKGDIESKQHRLQVSQLKGSQRSAFGASGALVDEGSAMDVLQDTTRFGELDALTIQNNAALEAWGYKGQAGSLRAQAGLLRSQKRSTRSAVVGSLLGSASSFGSSYAGAKAGAA